MAKSGDLIALGAWYGTGQKGGLMSIFLMGVYDETSDRFCTVTKVDQGLDDKTLESLQSLKMIKISGDADKLPLWLKCTKTMIPDFVAEDPKKQPIWEISGAEFTRQEVHTADGISISFPRITKFRDDKTWKTATTLLDLKELYQKSKKETDDSILKQGLEQEDNGQKRKTSMKNEVSGKKQKIEEKGEEEGEETEEEEEEEGGETKEEEEEGGETKEEGKGEEKVEEEEEEEKGEEKVEEVEVENEPTTSTGKRHSDSSPTKKVFKKPKLECSAEEEYEELLSSIYNKEIKVKNPKANYFKDIRLFVERTLIEKHPQWIRYFVAYGGTLVKPEDLLIATHYLHIEKTTRDPIRIPGNMTVKHMTLDWIKDTIANKRLMPDSGRYRVIWLP